MVTLTFLKFFGKKIGFDYDSPHGSDYDDWDNNAQAYLFFSLIWIVVAPMFLFVVSIKLLYKFVQIFLKYPHI